MDMDDVARRILRLPDPWIVEGATVIEDRKEVEVRVTFKATKAPSRLLEVRTRCFVDLRTFLETLRVFLITISQIWPPGTGNDKKWQRKIVKK